MVLSSITGESAMAVSADQAFAALSAGDEASLRMVWAGVVDSVKVEGDGGPGSRYTFKFNPAVGSGSVLRCRMAARDNAARVITWDEVAIEGGELAVAPLKSQVLQVKVEPASASGCVAKVSVECERVDGTLLSPADQAKLMNGYVGLVKMAEQNMAKLRGVFA